MTNPTTAAGNTPGRPAPLAPAVLDLLAAVVEALDVPLPGLDDADEREQHLLMERRTSSVRAMFAAIVAHPVPLDGREARMIRRNTELSPVTYKVWAAHQDGGDRS